MPDYTDGDYLDDYLSDKREAELLVSVVDQDIDNMEDTE